MRKKLFYFFCLYLCSLTILSCNINLDPQKMIKDNYEATRTETIESKMFVTNLLKYTKASGVKYSDKQYSFDNMANISITYKKHDFKKELKFWGMSPDNSLLAYYYIDKSYGYNYNYYSVEGCYKYEDGHIKYENNQYSNMLSVMLEVDTNLYYDQSKINPIQTNTPNSVNWKNIVSGKTLDCMNYFGNFEFDEYGNVFVTFSKKSRLSIVDPPRDKKLNFFSAIMKDGELLGLYYEEHNGLIYGDYILKLSDKNTIIEILDIYKTDIEAIIHPIDTTTRYDSAKLKTPQINTQEAKDWINSVALKVLREKYDVIYRFLSGGNINIFYPYFSDTINFWGAIDETRGIYYTKVKLVDKYIDSPDQEYYDYFGLQIDAKNKKTYIYELSKQYKESLSIWESKYFDENGKPKYKNINWASMPLPKTSYINWDEISSEYTLE